MLFWLFCFLTKLSIKEREKMVDNSCCKDDHHGTSSHFSHIFACHHHHRMFCLSFYAFLGFSTGLSRFFEWELPENDSFTFTGYANCLQVSINHKKLVQFCLETTCVPAAFTKNAVSLFCRWPTGWKEKTSRNMPRAFFCLWRTHLKRAAIV